MNQIGRYALVLGLAAAGWSALAGFIGARRHDRRATRTAEGGLRAAAFVLSVAAFALFYAFVTRDFSLEYVASYSSRSLSMFYTLGAFWAGQSGSLLLWAWVLALYGAVAVWQNRTRNRELMMYVVPVIGAVLTFFVFLVVFLSNPFAASPVVPVDGQGLNPLLQNYGQWIHPVTLYMGYVGFTIPFAFAVAALATGDLGDVWIRTVRKWSLWSWLLLTVGIMFGARWAYVELGWGGFWGWDPVENASLLPWLTGTAYLHSVMIQEKRGMLKVWNVFLIVATFALSIFGTFLTRSGVISSVHSFSESSIGPFLILAVVAVVMLGGGLIVWRLPHLKAANRIDSAVSRESSFLVNNLVLLGMAFTVFWGTVFPLVAEAVRGVKVSVGGPFFEALMTPLALVLLALAGLCPLLAWRKASVRNVRRNFAAPAIAAFVGGAILFLLSRGRHLGADVVFALSIFVGTTIVQEFWRGMRARRATRGEGWARSFAGLFSRNPRRYGGYLIHLGVVILLTGVAINASYKTEKRLGAVEIGQPVAVGGYTITLRSMRTEATPERSTVIATFGLRDADGKDMGTVDAEKSFWATQEQPSTEVGIRSTPMADIYIILTAPDVKRQIAAVSYLINPGMYWIWLGALIVVAGGLIVGRPQRRRHERPKEVLHETRELVPAGSVGAAV
jgi:cytochrome c-type biogenesis protein CcmF